MKKVFTTGMWNYNRNGFFDGPEEVVKWKKLGINTITCPEFTVGKSDPDKQRAILDEAQKYGQTALLQILDILYKGEPIEEYEKKIQFIVDNYANHPAVEGFYIGEEPSEYDMPFYETSLKTFNKICPNLTPYMNMGGLGRQDNMCFRGTISFREWILDLKKSTNLKVIGLGNYEIMNLNAKDAGTENFMREMREVVAGADTAGVDVWMTLVCSAHYWFNTPTRDDCKRMINLCATGGCKGVIWFKLYDKPMVSDYRDSPFNEFGEESPTFYAMSEAQRHFLNNYGELFMRLKRKTTYCLWKAFGGYPLYSDIAGKYFNIGCPNEVPGLISFFECDDGWHYAAITNNCRDRSATYNICFNENVEEVYDVRFNGDYTAKIASKGEEYEMWLSPGEMNVIKFR